MKTLPWNKSPARLQLLDHFAVGLFTWFGRWERPREKQPTCRVFGQSPWKDMEKPKEIKGEWQIK